MQVLYLGPDDSLNDVREYLGEDYYVNLALEEDDVDKIIPTCEVVLDAYMRIRFPEDRILKAKKLKLFVTATTGADHIDAEVLFKNNIPLLTLRDQKEVIRDITPAAEHSWLLLMACARQLRAAVGGVIEGEWDRNKYPGIMLKGKVLGIIGCGRIGTWMSRYACAFGMKCLAYDPYIEDLPINVEKADLITLLSQSDFISIHVPLNEETRMLIDENAFRFIKHGSVLINTSRGEVIDELELLRALRQGKILAAGLDVLAGEPSIAKNPLLEYAKTHDKLVITPHIGGYSPDALRYVLSFSCRRIKDFFKAMP